MKQARTTDACVPPESLSRTRQGFVRPRVSGCLTFRLTPFALKSPQSVTLKRKLREAWAASKWGAALSVFVGVVVVLLRTPLERVSYDLPHLVRPEVQITNVAIVYMDDATHALRNQPYEGPWDRSLHAQLISVLTRSGAKAIAFDELFTDPGTNAKATEALAQAIRAHGRVVLGVDLGSGDYYGLASEL